MSLETELATFERELPKLMKNIRGQFVLIHGETVDSAWKTEDEAYTAGCQRFGVKPFLVMLVEDPEPPIPVFQDIPPYAGNSKPA
jgi:hypothetical protein